MTPSFGKPLAALVVLSTLVLLFFAAKPKQKPEKLLIGKWEYCSGSGGFTGKGPGWNAAEGIYFEFKKNGKFKKIEYKKTVENDTYQTQPIKDAEQKTQSLKIIFKKLPPMLAVFSGDSLYLSEELADGFTYVFARSR